jgi:prepilin-type N-terminal cleavage/methylation domain-containing protein
VNDSLPAIPRRHHPAKGCAPGARRAFTLIELILAMSILAIVGTAVVGLLFGASNTDRFLRSCSTAQSETDLALRRIINNIRTAQSGSIVVGTSTLSTLSAPDPADNYPSGATVSYALATDPANSSQNVLQETDQRYGTNTLVHNVTTFSVTAVSGVSSLYQVDLVVGSPSQEERHVKVYARN